MSIPRPDTGWDVKGVTTHPGAVPREEFLVPMELTVNGLSLQLRVPATRMHEIVNERRGVSPDTAMRLARYFGTTAAFWLNLQVQYDDSKAKVEWASTIEREVEPRTVTAA